MKENFFNADNLGLKFSEFTEEIRRGAPTAVFGVSESMKYLAASVIESPILYLTADANSARKAVENLSAISGKETARIAAKDEVLTYGKALSKDSLFVRLSGIDKLYSGCPVCVAEIDALLQLFPIHLPKIAFIEGRDYNFSSLPEKLVNMGYIRTFEVETRGTFALRGDILDIYPVSGTAFRADFFGDTLEKIKPYDILTGERLESVKKVEVISATDVFISEEDFKEIGRIFERELKTFKTSESYARAKQISEEIQSEGNQEKYDFLMPILKNSTSIFQILPKNTVIVFDEGKTLWDKFNGLYKEFEERYLRLLAGGEVFPFSSRQLISKEEFIEKLSSFRVCALQTFTGNPFFFQPLKIFDLPSTPMTKYLNGIPTLMTDIKNWLRGGYRILLYTGNESRAAKMGEILSAEYLPENRLSASLDNLHGVCVLPETFDKGFILHEAKLAVIGTTDLYTKPTMEKRIRRKRGDMFVAPEIGDYAVHETHGIGRVIGTRMIETTDGTKECVALEYKDGDVLYLPAERMDVLSKYVGEQKPSLSKIGGADFERVKARVRASLKKLAFDLKALYAAREEQRGFNFPSNQEFMAEFEEAFPYELTPDQKSSVEEIKSDMCSPKVMDRLLCGDVGFGKTEVAFRAIYLCVLGGKQAALMCPSTVLCSQHFNTATARFQEFGVRIAALNRFNTPREQEKILAGLNDGSVDLVIGTHRLLSSDVKFKDLGLLVLDEEQRFGVEHKEKIKHLRKDIDCLTMTATPIPRTLHMSLSGIRDISTIQTPPTERLPVQTYVVEETETLIRDGCIRELSRGGQVFILYNKVESIFTFAAKVGRIVPEAVISVAHGRMDKTMLENNVYDFYAGKSNVLITTTIIENGIDLPNANTLIVIDSDRLGISQLYQLKGRVGRSTRLAYAYFTYKAEKVMTENASSRLKAIMEFTELGSGYKLAMRDLEIRGAGNVLGAEQHGHMDRVGYELYGKLLKEELTGERQELAELDIRADAYISEKYIESSAGRLDTYKQIAEIATVEDYKRVFSSLEEIYGAVPQATINLLVIAVLKSYASKFNIRKITAAKGFGSLEFPSLKSLGDKRIQAALDKYQQRVRLNMAISPVVEFIYCHSPIDVMAEMTKFLKFSLTFKSL